MPQRAFCSLVLKFSWDVPSSSNPESWLIRGWGVAIRFSHRLTRVTPGSCTSSRCRKKFMNQLSLSRPSVLSEFPSGCQDNRRLRGLATSGLCYSTSLCKAVSFWPANTSPYWSFISQTAMTLSLRLGFVKLHTGDGSRWQQALATSLRHSVHRDFQMPAQHRHLFVEGFFPKRMTAALPTCPWGPEVLWHLCRPGFSSYMAVQFPGGIELQVFTVVAGLIAHTLLAPFFPVLPPIHYWDSLYIPKQLIELNPCLCVCFWGIPN